MVSVVIPAYNEEGNIAKTLASLTNQKTSHEYEVIVVDNNSNDRTREEAKKFSKKLRLKIIREKKQGRGAARATGIRAASGEIIACVDADTRVKSNWIEKLVYDMAKPDVVATTGPWRMREGRVSTRSFVHRTQKVAMLPFKMMYGCYWLTGLNCAFKKDAYDKSGGFDARLNAHEDIDLTLRMRKLGKILYDDNLVVETSGRRWRGGVLSGLWSYQKPAVELFLFGKKDIYLPDER